MVVVVVVVAADVVNGEWKQVLPKLLRQEWGECYLQVPRPPTGSRCLAQSNTTGSDGDEEAGGDDDGNGEARWPWPSLEWTLCTTV